MDSGASRVVVRSTGVERASATLRNVTGAWVKEQKVLVVDGKITSYDVVIEITFVLDDRAE